MKLDDNGIPRIVKNEWFYLLARGCMVAATVIGLPVAGFMLQRVISTADEIVAGVNKQAGKLDLLSQRMEMQFRYDGNKLEDHESRLRAMEFGKRP